jgi:hypothetical protein
LRDGSEALKLFSLVAASAVVVFAVWLMLDRGGRISGLGKSQTEVEAPMTATRPAEPPAPPVAQAQSYQPREINPPAQRSKQAAGTMYKWVDEKGTIHFSDQPRHSDAERIAVAQVTTYKNQEPRPAYRQVSTNEVYAQGSHTVAQVNLSGQTEQIGRGRFRTSAGHVITASGKHFGNLLSFEGRVEGGTRCSALYLRGCLTSKSGNSRCFDAVASDVGGSGGRLFDSRADRVNMIKEGWEVTSVTAYCQ